MKERNIKVIILPNLGNPPEENEIQIAQIIAEHYNAMVEFLRPVDDYKQLLYKGLQLSGDMLY